MSEIAELMHAPLKATQNMHTEAFFLAMKAEISSI